MAITTSKQSQAIILAYYKAGLKAKNITIVSSTRGGPHLRINYSGDVSILLNKIHPCKIYSSSYVISGTFPTQEIEITKPLPGTSIKDRIYLVVTVKKTGILNAKDLTPDSLGVGGSIISKSLFLATITTAINKSKQPEHIKSFVLELMEASNTPSGRIKSKHIEIISDSDIKVIAKNFGEISGSYWFMTQFNKKVSKIEYPKESNAALIDYYAVIDKNKRIAISAKANAGAPPSINAIAHILSSKMYSEVKKESARKAIIAISDNSVVDGIVEAAKDLNHIGYIWLKKNIFNNKNFTANDCEFELSKINSAEEMTKKLSPLYSLIGRSASLEITKRIFDTNAKRYGLIISPLGYALVDELNSNEIYTSVLNDAATSIIATQLYMQINKSTKMVEYEVKEFSESIFKFEYNANAGQPSLKKISFKMQK